MTPVGPNGEAADQGNLPQQYTTNTAQRNYGDNERAEVYFPGQGWVVVIMMDIVESDEGKELQKCARAEYYPPSVPICGGPTKTMSTISKQ